MSFSPQVDIAPSVTAALAHHAPVVALETAVLTHGLPRPLNLEVVRAMAAAVRAGGATPAIVGALDGRFIVGLDDEQLDRLADAAGAVKASIRDLPVVAARGLAAGTTVATTAWLAHRAGINVFATGGIGGVHRGAAGSFDISADLPVLATTPLVVVCAGAKTVLDLPATLEWLETAGVPVVGYGVDELPGFFAPTTGLRLAARADTPAEVAAIVAAQRALGLRAALVLAAPPPAAVAVPPAEAEAHLAAALADLAAQGIHGNAVTPFLLRHLAEHSGGATLRANIALLTNNAAVGAAIAAALVEGHGATERRSP
ncbi:MAG: pseudouridine-5'-phosphate glycosidase [Chloroflexi bacterium]|nr:pseudouridine-5'-phosphate glycosidase [Chloroflexota bacterium]